MTRNDYKDVFRQMEREMQQLTDEVFRGFFEVPTRGGKFWQPHVDVHEGLDTVHMKVELPGANPDEIAVSLSSDDRILTIAGVRKEPDGDRQGRVRCHQLEIYFGPFERSIALPQHVQIERDSVRASYRDGFLIVTLPKKTVPSSDAKKIPIVNESAQAGREAAIGDSND